MTTPRPDGDRGVSATQRGKGVGGRLPERTPWFERIAEEAVIPKRRWGEMSAEEAFRTYTQHGWPVYATGNDVYVVLGERSGLTAVRGPRLAVAFREELRRAWFITEGNEATVLYAHPGGSVRTTTVKVPVTMPEDIDDPENRRNQQVTVEFTVLGDGTAVGLPGSRMPGRSWTWKRDAELGDMPLLFQRAMRPSARLVATPLTGRARESPLALPGGLCRPGELTLLSAVPGTGTTMLSLAVAVRVMVEGGHVVYLDYDGVGAGEIGERLTGMGVVDDGLLDYVESPAPLGDGADLEPLLRPESRLVVVDSLPAWCHANGGSDRLGEHVIPGLRALQRFARSARCAVLLTDKVARGRRPRGATEKEEIVQVSWLVRSLARIEPEHDGLVVVEKNKDRGGRLREQNVAVRSKDGRIEVEFDADGERVAGEQVRRGVVEAVRRESGRLTKEQLSNAADVPGPRRVKRQVVEELEAEGVLRRVAARRAEQGQARTRQVYEVVEP